MTRVIQHNHQDDHGTEHVKTLALSDCDDKAGPWGGSFLVQHDLRAGAPCPVV